VNNIKKYLTLHLKSIFLFDGIGALITTFFMAVILKTFNKYVGMPKIILIYFFAISAVFSLYSFTCFFILKANLQPFLKTIIVANSLHCFLTALLVLCHYQNLTILGMAYFLAELVVIGGLAFIELKTLRTIQDE
jgi:lysylphosphatidylglycerol synthetase-like protein (DUF2156 family)